MPSPKKRRLHKRKALGVVVVGGREIPVYLNPRLKRQAGIAYRIGNKPYSIELNPDDKPLARLSTLLHEMLHQTDWRLSEGTVLKLEERLLALVLSNPSVFQQILRYAPRS